MRASSWPSRTRKEEKTPTRVIQHQTISRLFEKNKSRKSETLWCVVSPRVATTNGRLGKRVGWRTSLPLWRASYIPRKKNDPTTTKKREQNLQTFFESSPKNLQKTNLIFPLSLFRRWAGWLVRFLGVGLKCRRVLSSCWLFTNPPNKYIYFLF